MFEVLIYIAGSVAGLAALVLLYLLYRNLTSLVYQLETLNKLVVSTTEGLDTVGFRNPETLDKKEMVRRYLLRRKIINHFLANEVKKVIEAGVGTALKRAFKK